MIKIQVSKERYFGLDMQVVCLSLHVWTVKVERGRSVRFSNAWLLDLGRCTSVPFLYFFLRYLYRNIFRCLVNCYLNEFMIGKRQVIKNELIAAENFDPAFVVPIFNQWMALDFLSNAVMLGLCIIGYLKSSAPDAQ